MSGTFASPLRGILRQAIHVKIRPRPHTLAESTGVLRVLQEYGEIFYFKHLRVRRQSSVCYGWFDV